MSTTESTPRVHFAHRLEELQQDVLRMGGVVEQMLHKAMEAYRRRDPLLVQQVIAMDDIVDRYNLDIETAALHLLALQNPLARDLRVIAATMKVITDIERVGDYCIDIAKTADRLAAEPELPLVPGLAAMATLASQMLRETLAAFVSRDLQMVRRMIEHDDEVDHLNKRIHNDMVALVREDPRVAAPAIGVLMIARYLERIADHITNVGERVYYMETGDHKELHQ